MSLERTQGQIKSTHPSMFLNKKRGDKPWVYNGFIKRQTTPLPSLQNGQVFKSNRTYTLREFPERFAKDWIRFHELSPLSKGQSICVFQKNQIKITKQGKNVMNIVKLSITLYCCKQSPLLPHFKTKVACIWIPTNHVNYIDFLHLQSNLFEFGMTGPLKE